MLFPFRNTTPRRPIVSDKLDRYALLNSARLFAGLSLNANFTQLAGSLIVTEGRGKHLRLRHLEAHLADVPAPLATSLQAQATSPDGNWPPLLADLAEFQAAEFDRLKRMAGRFVDRILGLAVTDPGIWLSDFDGKRTYLSACDPCKLSDLTGVSVIDAFPARDLAAGGQGGHLEALPLWLWLADRPQKSARYSTALLLLDRQLAGNAWFLPGSDGLDELLPEVERLEISAQRLAPQHLAATLQTFFRRHREGCLPLREFFCATADEAGQRVAAEVSQQLALPHKPLPLLSPEHNLPATAGAVAAALLGALFVDQMPANMPPLTGASVQRLLGRITPGNPNSWRNLLLNMTDSQAPTMKLRDAI